MAEQANQSTIPVRTPGKRERKATLEVIPLDEIRDAQGKFEQVHVKVQRVNTKSQWMGLPGAARLMDTKELPDINDWLAKDYGGGQYRVSCSDPQDRTCVVIPPWWEHVDGPPKAVRAVPSHTPAAHLAATPGAPPPAHYPPYPGYPPPYPQQSDDGTHLDPSQIWAQPPDALATQHANEAKAEARAERERREQDRRESEARMEKITAEMAAMQKAHAADMARVQKEQLDARIEALQQQQAPATDWTGIGGVVAPVIVALIESNSSRSLQLAQMNQKSAEAQTTAITALAKPAPKDDSWVKALGTLVPAVAPMLKDWVSSNSPLKQAEMVANLGDSQMAMLGMVQQFISQFDGDERPPWVPFAEQALKGIQDVAEQMAQARGAGPGSSPMGPGGPSKQQMPAQAQQQPTQLSPDSTPEDMANAILNSPGWPANMKTQRWFELMVMVHGRQTIADTAMAIGQHLASLDELNQLPQPFVGLFNDGTNPAEMLQSLLMQLPIGQLDSQYAQQLAHYFGTEVIVDEESQNEPQPNGQDGPAFTKTPGPIFDTEGETVEKG